MFEATVNKYYLNRVMPSSVSEEYRNSLKDFYIKYVSMLEEECLELTNAGVCNVAGTFLNLETDALKVSLISETSVRSLMRDKY